MTRLKLLTSTLFSILFSFSAMAQSNSVEAWREMSVKLETTNEKLANISSIINFGGRARKDVYLDSDWSSGAIYTKEKEFLNCVVRYNIHKDRMEIKLGSHVRNLMKNKINGIIIGEDLFVLMASEDKSTHSYHKVLAEGELTLTYKYNLTTHSSGGGSALHPNLGSKQEYRVNKKMFYFQTGKSALKFKKGKKNVLKILANHRVEIEDFAKSRGIGFKKEKDLIKLFNKYNELSR